MIASVLGLAFVVVGLVLGVAETYTMGGMLFIVLGTGTVGLGLVLKD